MAKRCATVSDLRKAADVTDQEIDASVNAYVAKPAAAPFRFASGHEIDAAAAVNSYRPAIAAVVDPNQTAKFKWTMIRTAVLLTHPAKE